MRLKETHFLNMPTYANKVIEFAMTILNDKLKKRVIVSNPRFLHNMVTIWHKYFFACPFL